MAEQLSRPSTTITLAAAARLTRMTYARLRSLAVDRREFTTIRDPIGKGVQIYLRRDEVAAFEAGDLAGLRSFRARTGRWPQTGGEARHQPSSAGAPSRTRPADRP